MSVQTAKIVAIENSSGYQKLLSGVPETSGMKSGCVILKPGESVGAHSTGDKEEAIVILEGVVQVCLGAGRDMTARQNQLVYIPPRTTHDMKNTGAGVSRYVYVVVPVVNSQLK